MPKLVAVCGATGTQGGAVADLLLQHPEDYRVRALTRYPYSAAAQGLAALGAEVMRADFTVLSEVDGALRGCWGVFAVTNSFSQEAMADPACEEQQGMYLVDAALKAHVKCFIWSTLPNSKAISDGRFASGPFDGLPATFLYLGCYYENLVHRNRMRYNHITDKIEFQQPLIEQNSQLPMVYVKKDLSAVVKAVFDHWDRRRDELQHTYHYVASAQVTASDLLASVANLTGKQGIYKCLGETGSNREHEIMARLCNEVGLYREQTFPDGNILRLGVRMHDTDDFVRDVLAAHLKLPLV